MQAIVGQPTRVRLPNLYGPQVGFLFVAAGEGYRSGCRAHLGRVLSLLAVCRLLLS